MKKLAATFSSPGMWHVRRFAAILLSVCLIDVCYVLTAPRPLPGAAFIPAVIPLLVCVFIVIPLSHERKS